MIGMFIQNRPMGISVLPPSRAQLEARSKKYGVPLSWIDPRPRHRWQRVFNVPLAAAVLAACVILYGCLHFLR